MSMIFQRPDGSARKVSGYRYAAPRPGTPTWTRSRAGRLPRRVDLRPFMTEVEDQGQTNSCAANAVAGAYEYLVKQHLGEEAYDVSRMFIYYNGRAVDGCEGEDEGSYIRSLIESLREHGACSEETWPFDPERVNEQPSDEAYEEASEFLVEDMAVVPTELDAWRAALAEGCPIIFGLSLFDSFDRQRQPGLVQKPSPRETARESHAGHAMLAVGYSDPDRVFIVRNSWGSAWGDEGYCYIPYDYILDPKHNLGDSWIIRQLEVVPSSEGWSDEEESMLPEIDSEFAEMTEEAFAALHDACGAIPFETRLAHLFLLTASVDGEASDEELAALGAELVDTFERAGSDLEPERVLRYAARHLDDEALFSETLEIFGEHLSQGLLANFIEKARAIAEADELGDEESELIDALVEAWQIEA
jgi:hypothetical protein